jgi:hypothetical protein
MLPFFKKVAGCMRMLTCPAKGFSIIKPHVSARE